MAIKTQNGSGNVFADLGFPPDEAVNLQLRSDLMMRLRTRLETLQQRALRLEGQRDPARPRSLREGALC